jgi:hypothetical protein
MAAVPFRSGVRLVKTLDELRIAGVVAPAEKRPNPKKRKKQKAAVFE